MSNGSTKRIAAVLLVFGLASVFALGVFAMNHETGHGNGLGNCLGAISERVACPAGVGAVSFANFHLEAFKNITTFVFNQTALYIYALLFAFFLFTLFLARFRKKITEGVAFPLFVFESIRPKAHSGLRKLTSWLSLHENSPAF